MTLGAQCHSTGCGNLRILLGWRAQYNVCILFLKIKTKTSKKIVPYSPLKTLLPNVSWLFISFVCSRSLRGTFEKQHDGRFSRGSSAHVPAFPCVPALHASRKLFQPCWLRRTVSQLRSLASFLSTCPQLVRGGGRPALGEHASVFQERRRILGTAWACVCLPCWTANA